MEIGSLAVGGAGQVRYLPGRHRTSGRALSLAAIIALHVGVVALLLHSHAPRLAVAAMPAMVALLTQTSPQQPQTHQVPTSQPVEVPVPAPVLPVVDVTIPVESTPALAAPAPAAADAPAATQPAVVTNAVPPLVSDLAFLVPPATRMPELARRKRMEGVAQILVLVDELGRPRQVQVHSSSGFEVLDQAALEAVKRALFRPYMENGVARSVRAIVPIEFVLKPAAGTH